MQATLLKQSVAVVDQAVWACNKTVRHLEEVCTATHLFFLLVFRGRLPLSRALYRHEFLPSTDQMQASRHLPRFGTFPVLITSFAMRFILQRH